MYSDVGSSTIGNVAEEFVYSDVGSSGEPDAGLDCSSFYYDVLMSHL